MLEGRLLALRTRRSECSGSSAQTNRELLSISKGFEVVDVMNYQHPHHHHHRHHHHHHALVSGSGSSSSSSSSNNNTGVNDDKLEG